MFFTGVIAQILLALGGSTVLLEFKSDCRMSKWKQYVEDISRMESHLMKVSFIVRAP